MLPGEFLSANGSIVKPHKKLDKEAYRDLVMEEENRQLRLEIQTRKRRLEKNNPNKKKSEFGSIENEGLANMERINARIALKNANVPDDELEVAIKKKVAIEKAKKEREGADLKEDDGGV